MQGTLVPQGQQDVLNTAIGKLEHPGRVRVAGTGVTITQYFGKVSLASSTSSLSLTQAQLAEIISGIKDEVRREVEEEDKHLKESWKREFEAEQIRNLQIMKQQLEASIKFELSHCVTSASTGRVARFLGFGYTG